jgi:autotransporter-associated beta strand protein
VVAAVDQGPLYTSVGQRPVITYTAPVAPGAYPFTFQVEDDGVGENLDPSPKTITINVPPPDYLITTADHAIVVTDQTGHGDTLTVSEPSPGHILFSAAGRAFSVDGGLYRDGDSGSIALADVTSITLDAGSGDDTVTVQEFTNPLPSLAIDGGTGADTVSLHAGTTATVSDPDGVTLEGGSVSTLLTVDSDVAVSQTAALTGPGGLQKSGAGTLTLDLDNSFSGNTTVQRGTLALAASTSHNNVASSPALVVASGATLDVTGLMGGRLDLVSGQILRCAGTVRGNLGVGSGATLAPGASPGILNSGSVVFSPGSTFEVEIEGPTVGTQYDQLNVAGTVDLGHATLSLLGSYPAAYGDSLIIVNNDGNEPVTGTFAGLDESGTIGFNGVDLILSYAGGDGNDVTLSRPPPAAARLAYFRAVRGEDDQVQLSWGTLIEVHTLGYRVDRSTLSGEWERITPQIIPATGVDQRPQTYALTDSTAPALADLRYRLGEIDLRGREEVLAVAAVQAAPRASLAVSDDGLCLSLHGTPNALVTIETAVAVSGPWTVVQTSTLDGGGVASAKLEWASDLAARFYRISSE